jgi:hypothetical protein
MATRRAFLAGLAATLAPRPTWAEVGSPAFLAAARAGQDYVLHGLTETGDSLFSLPLPARGHAAAAHPTLALAVAFARRPGTFALVIDCLRGTTAARLTPPEGRQFNGHGVFAGDGALLMTSEVAAETSDGLLGLWETATWARIGEWPTGGIGPHDLRCLPDGRLVVANGGIRTDPTDRRKLNLDTMRPNLTLLAADGEILDQAALPEALHRNSIRHLARQGDAIAFAMQWEGDAAEPVPQLGLWTPGSAPMLCPPDDTQAFAMKGYAGSIATAPGLVALTSAPGGALMLFDAAGAPLATHRRADVSGVALGPRGLVATDGQGGIWAVDGQRLQLLAHHPVAWDNHLVSLA